jgi:hypothetical protein
LEWLLKVGLGMARFGVAAECDLAGELEASTMLKKQRTEWSFLQG